MLLRKRRHLRPPNNKWFLIAARQAYYGHPHPHKSPEKDGGGLIYWSEINTIDSASKVAENKGGYSIYEEKTS